MAASAPPSSYFKVPLQGSEKCRASPYVATGAAKSNEMALYFPFRCSKVPP